MQAAKGRAEVLRVLTLAPPQFRLLPVRRIPFILQLLAIITAFMQAQVFSPVGNMCAQRLRSFLLALVQGPELGHARGQSGIERQAVLLDIFGDHAMSIKNGDVEFQVVARLGKVFILLIIKHFKEFGQEFVKGIGILRIQK